MSAFFNKGLWEYAKKTKFYFVGAYRNLNRLWQYTRTRPQNETKLGRIKVAKLKHIKIQTLITSH